ncbi:MAG: hypothetical protein R3E09_03575 [Novosphingobium sp.]|nr:hypothetical protein [Novosphingobium sp.]
MRSPARFVLTGLASVALLAGCDSSSNKAADTPEDDPALSGALGDQIMVDPELTGQDQANAGVSAGSGKIELPPELRSPEAIAAARGEAAKLAGGVINPAPKPIDSSGIASLIENAATAAQVAQAAKTNKVDCAQKAEYSMNWASSMPEPLGVYPRGAVQEAAGTDKDGCSMRVVSFATPVSPEDVIDFYYTRVRAAGYDARHGLDGRDHVLGGSKGAAAYLIYARKLDNGVTEVDLIASGS